MYKNISNLAELIRCPYCGDKVQYLHYGTDRLNNNYGVLLSGCAEFPVVADIPVLGIGVVGNHGESNIELVDYIKTGQYEKALFAMVIPSPKLIEHQSGFLLSIKNKLIKRNSLSTRKIEAILKATKRFNDICNDPTVEEMLRFYFMENGNNRKSLYEYFLYRYGLPRHITTLGSLQIIKDNSKPIVEIGCGFGHMTREILKHVNNSFVVGIDKSFFALYVAKRMTAPKAEFLCYDVNKGIPFEDDTFYASVAIDGIHYIEQKYNIIHEMKRVISSDGIIMLISSRNANIKFDKAGIPLTPGGYKNLIGNTPNRIIADSEIVLSYLENRGPDLLIQTSIDNLKDEPLLTIIASNDESKFTWYEELEKDNFINKRLSLNPLYQSIEIENNEHIVYHRRFPPNYNKNDSVDCSVYLPEKVYIERENMYGINNDDKYKIKSNLIDNFIYLDLPDRYCFNQSYKYC